MESELTAGISHLYRLALLLTGNGGTAAAVLRETLADAGDQIGQIRSERARSMWIVDEIRTRCLRPETEVGPRGLDHLAPQQQATVLTFFKLPEPQRTIAALFYLDFLTVTDMAQMLEMDVETLSDQLHEARLLLRQQGETRPPMATP